MHVESVTLKNFRNYQDKTVLFKDGLNIIVGQNASGKTNLLESVYVAGIGRSPRTNKYKDMIRWGSEYAYIKVTIKKNKSTHTIEYSIDRQDKKRIAIDGIPLVKLSEILGMLNIVFFSPDEMKLVKESPVERRRFMDLELCQLDQLYLTDLAGYNHIVNQRNRLLKDLFLHPGLKDTLDVWDAQILSYGRKIILKRQEFVEELNAVIREIHKNLTGGEELLEVIYEPSADPASFEEIMKKNREKDIRLKMTSAGPHRDDLCFMVNGIDIRKYGSQGQQRTAALSLKLSEIYLVKKKIKDTPVLLLDDVLSELDANRQTYLLDSIHDIQTLITCTGLDDFISHQFHINKVFRVIRGEVFNPVHN